MKEEHSQQGKIEKDGKSDDGGKPEKEDKPEKGGKPDVAPRPEERIKRPNDANLLSSP